MVGIDEVGRGCWAGPLLVVAARAKSDLPAGLKDSKLLSKTQREKILDLLSICCNFGEGWVSVNEIDKHGLGQTLRLGVERALKDLNADTKEEIIMDGKVNYVPTKYKSTKCLVDADNLVPIVSAASIYAKVMRDKYMNQLAQKHPLYGFEKHAGYGTKLHMEALSAYGLISSVHRLSFAPIAKLVNLSA